MSSTTHFLAVRADPARDPDGSKLYAYVDAHVAYATAKTDRQRWMLASTAALSGLAIVHLCRPHSQILVFFILLAGIVRTLHAGAVEHRNLHRRWQPHAGDVAPVSDADLARLADHARVES